MEVRYTLTLDDYIAFCMHRLRKDLWESRVFMVFWIGPPVFFAAVAVVLVFLDEWYYYSGAALSLIFGVGCAVMFPAEYRTRLERSIRKDEVRKGTRGVLGPITLILSEESLVEITETIRSECKWKDIKGVEEVGDWIIIQVSGHLSAIIPRLAFAHDEDYYAVRDFAFRKLADRQPD